MTTKKMDLLEKIPPFRIFSTLYRTVYVSSFSPFVRVRTILNLDKQLIEGSASVSVTIMGISSRDILPKDPTIKDLIDMTRQIAAHIAQTLDRINEAESGKSRRIVMTLVATRVFWCEDDSCFHCQIEDLMEDGHGQDGFIF